MAHISKRHSRPGLGGTTARAKAMALPTVAVRGASSPSALRIVRHG